MPELPEVETVMRGLEPVMRGRRFKGALVRRADLRGRVPSNFSKALAGRKITALVRRGKYIIFKLDNRQGFGLHLGMSGRVRVYHHGMDEKPGAHDHVIFTMDDGAQIVFNDPRRFGSVFLTSEKWENEKPFSQMGAEPLGNQFNAKELSEKLAGKKVPIKNALLDQRVVAGVGNIYACEALFAAGICPLKKSGAIKKEKISALVSAVRKVLEKAIAQGGSTLRDHRKTDGTMGYFQHHFSVYDREGQSCPGCSCNIVKTGGIQRITQGGRSTFYCPRKQN